MADRFESTHVVPGGGLSAWSAPEGSVPPVARLDAGLDIAVTERRGDWARVLCSNGWSGWVDGRGLVESSRQAQPGAGEPDPTKTIVAPAATPPPGSPAVRTPEVGTSPPPAAAGAPPSATPASPQPAAFGQPQAGYGSQTAAGTNGLAIAALVLGFIPSCVTAILAIVFGFLAKSQIDRTGGTQGGRGMAIAGIVLGFAWVGIWIVVIIVVAATSGSNTSNGSQLIGALPL
jgi:hypothetical protein